MKRVCEQLTACPLFSSFTCEELDLLLEEKDYRIRKYHPGQVLMHQGDQYKELLVILRGTVNAKFHEYSGKSMLVETLEAPSPIAAAVLFADVNYLPVTAEADDEVEVIILSRAAVLRLLQGNAEMMQKYLREMGSKLVFLAEKVRLAGMASLRQKIADYLLRMRDQYNRNAYSIPYTREKMAELLGAARPSLSRELSRMAEEKIITLQGRQVRILDPEYLQELLTG
jgi:CRP-like cAMP-binding protein